MVKAVTGSITNFYYHCEEPKMHVYRWSSENNGPVLLKWLSSIPHKLLINVSGCEWPAAGIEMDSNLKTSGGFFSQAFARDSDKID